MFRQIKVVPLAAESLGVRSMCTFVETPDVRVLLDAGVSLAPNRLGFPPHPREYEALRTCRQRIAGAAEKAEVVTISHFHFDHHTPSFEDWCYNWCSAEVSRKIYEGKTVLIKNYRSMVNFSQRRRGWMFSKTGGKHAEKLEVADGKVFKFGGTKLKFSEPVFHGSENTPLGWVLMTTIKADHERFLFTSDIQGPMYDPTLSMILAEKPQLIMIGGPPLYLAGLHVRKEDAGRGIRNLAKLVRNIPTTILEHHILREEHWRELSKPVFKAASEAGHVVVTAAEYVHEKIKVLEFQRRRLFENEPPSLEFQKWTNLPVSRRKKVKPPFS